LGIQACSQNLLEKGIRSLKVVNLHIKWGKIDKETCHCKGLQEYAWNVYTVFAHV
jgi:hypothetical protein